MARVVAMSVEEKERVKKMRAEGLKPMQICERMGISHSTVSFIVNADNVRRCSKCRSSGKLGVDFHSNGFLSSGKRRYSSYCNKCESERKKNAPKPRKPSQTQPTKIWPDRPAVVNVERMEPSYAET